MWYLVNLNNLDYNLGISWKCTKVGGGAFDAKREELNR